MNTHIRTGAALALAAALALTPSAVPCTTPCFPGQAKGVAVIWSEVEEISDMLWGVPLRILGYKIAGGGAGEFCTCAFGGTFDQIQSIDDRFAIYYAGTKTKIPGFDDFAENATATSEWDALAGGGGDWAGFLAPVLSDLPANTLVDLEFHVELELELGDLVQQSLASGGASVVASTVGTASLAGGDVGLPRSAIAAVLEEELASVQVGTDAATVNGVLLDKHQSLETLGDLIEQGSLAFGFVPGAIAGTAGTPSLTGSGDVGPGDDGALHLTAAKPNGPAFLVLGFAELGVSLKGGVLVPTPDIVIDIFTDGDGTTTLPWSDLPDLGSSFDLYTQVWIPDRAAAKNFSASNGLVMQFP